MSSAVYRKKRKRNGEVVLDSQYTGRFRLPWIPRERSISLKTKDKQVAEQRLNQYIQRLERERAGLPVPQDWWGGEFVELAKRLKDYKKHLETLGRGKKHIRDTIKRIETLTMENNWASVESITPTSFDKWRGQKNLSAKTLNEYLASANAFINWLIKNGFSKENPLACVQKVDGRGKEKKKRRAWSDDELRIVWNSDLFYREAIFIAARTGLRRNELQLLLWSDVHLDCENPFVLARASTTKNKKTEAIPLIPELVGIMQSMRPENWKLHDPVLTYKIPRIEKIRNDIRKLGLIYRNSVGKDLDFHALKYTYTTFLARNGVSGRQLQALCRHSDPKLSANVYTDASQIGTLDSVKNLPSTLECPAHGPANSDSTGQTLSQPVTKELEKLISQTVDSDEVSPLQAIHVLLRHVQENGCPGWNDRYASVVAVAPRNELRSHPSRGPQSFSARCAYIKWLPGLE